MADGTFAVMMLAAGLLDMNYNHCGTEAGCLGKSDTTPRIAISAGEWLERRATPQAEVYLRYDLGTKIGPFGNAIGFSYAEAGEIWIGAGQTYKYDFGRSNFYTELHAMPGLYFKNSGFDLGHVIEFRSGIEFGYESDAGWRYAISYDHRSNTGAFASYNPGVETVQFRVSKTLD